MSPKVNVPVVFKIALLLKIILSASAEDGVAPNPADAEIETFPAEIVVEPVNVFVPLKVSVPEPAFVNDPDPLITPDKVLLFTSPAVKVTPLASSTFPEPSIDAIVSDASTS